MSTDTERMKKSVYRCLLQKRPAYKGEECDKVSSLRLWHAKYPRAKRQREGVGEKAYRKMTETVEYWKQEAEKYRKEYVCI